MLLALLGCAPPGASDVGTPDGRAFDGIDDLVQAHGITGLDGDALTLEVWATLAPTGPRMGDLVDRRGPAGDTFLFRVRREPDPKLELGIGVPGQEWGLPGGSALPVGRPVMLAATHDRRTGDARLYVDGALDAAGHATAPIVHGDLPTWIGGDPKHGPTGRPFAGRLHAVLAFDTIRDVAADARARPPRDAPGLRLYWAGEGDSPAFTLGISPGPDASDPAP